MSDNHCGGGGSVRCCSGSFWRVTDGDGQSKGGPLYVVLRLVVRWVASCVVGEVDVVTRGESRLRSSRESRFRSIVQVVWATLCPRPHTLCTPSQTRRIDHVGRTLPSDVLPAPGAAASPLDRLLRETAQGGPAPVCRRQWSWAERIRCAYTLIWVCEARGGAGAQGWTGRAPLDFF